MATTDIYQDGNTLSRHDALPIYGLAPPVLVEDEKLQNFIDGDLGSFVSGPWERANLLTTAGDEFADKFGVVPLPQDEATGSFIGGSNLAVLADAANQIGRAHV